MILMDMPSIQLILATLLTEEFVQKMILKTGTRVMANVSMALGINLIRESQKHSVSVRNR